MNTVITEGALSCIDGEEHVYREGEWRPAGMNCISTEDGGYGRITADGLAVVPIPEKAAKATRSSDCVKFIPGGGGVLAGNYPC